MKRFDLPRGYIAAIGRPGIGGEFLLFRRGRFRNYDIERHKSTSTQRTEPRQLKVSGLPPDSMIHDLLSVIEEIIDDAEEHTSFPVDIDDRGIGGDAITLRERFAKLAKRERGK